MNTILEIYRRVCPGAVRLRVPAARTCRAAGVLLMALLAMPHLARPPVAAQEYTSAEDAWRFEPLGPDGADVIACTALGEGRFLARATSDRLMRWMPPGDGFRGGGWQQLDLPEESPVLHVSTRPMDAGRRLDALLLLANGALMTCEAAAHPAANDSLEAMSAVDSPCRFRVAGRFPKSVARETVAILPLEDGAGGQILLLTRSGGTWVLRNGTARSRGEARFRLPAQANSGAAPARRVHLRSAFLHPSVPGLIVAVTEWEGLLVSRDGARTFIPIGETLPRMVSAACPLPRGGLCVAGCEGIYVSRDRGEHWRLAESSYLARAMQCTEILSLHADPAVAGRLLAITRRGLLLRSQDGGSSWERLLGDLAGRVHALACDPAGSLILLGTSRGILASADGGDSWDWRNSGLRQVSVYGIDQCNDGLSLRLDTDMGPYLGSADGYAWLAVDDPRELNSLPAAHRDPVAFGEEEVIAFARAPGRSQAVLCRTASGLHWSPDGGESWVDVPVPGELAVLSLALDATGRRVLLGTQHGLFAAHPPRGPALTIHRPLPIEAHPNPFSEQVLLRCDLSPVRTFDAPGSAPAGTGDGNISLATGVTEDHESVSPGEPEMRIISVHGQLVHRLRSGELSSAGTLMQWSWDGRNERGQEAPNGIYLVATRIGEQSFVGKIVKFR